MASSTATPTPEVSTQAPAAPPASPRVSIVVPTLNGADELRRMLPALARQDFDGGYEICAIDSGSTDGTLELLREHGAHVRSIPRAEFRHGGTRNRCAREARGELLVFLSQDVEPADERFLAELVRPFEDPRVAGAYSRVLPHPDDDPLTARTVLDLPEAEGLPWVRDLDEIGPVWDMEPEERGSYIRFNNVASSIRASVFRTLPFPDVAFGEDFAWAARVLTAGWRIAYTPESRVYHAHCYSLAGAYARYRVDASFHRQMHGWRMRPTLLSAARGIAFEVGRDLRFLFDHPVEGRMKHAFRSPALRAAQVLGQYVGSR